MRWICFLQSAFSFNFSHPPNNHHLTPKWDGSNLECRETHLFYLLYFLFSRRDLHPSLKRHGNVKSRKTWVFFRPRFRFSPKPPESLPKTGRWPCRPQKNAFLLGSVFPFFSTVTFIERLSLTGPSGRPSRNVSPPRAGWTSFPATAPALSFSSCVSGKMLADQKNLAVWFVKTLPKWDLIRKRGEEEGKNPTQVRDGKATTHLRVMMEAVSLEDAHGGGIVSGWWWRMLVEVGSSQGDGGGWSWRWYHLRVMVEDGHGGGSISG